MNPSEPKARKLAALATSAVLIVALILFTQHIVCIHPAGAALSAM
jgi:hypothetical protein